MQIWIDAKYLGRAIRQGRCNARIKQYDAAKMLGLTRREYLKMEQGQKLVSEVALRRIMTLAFLQLRTRQFTGAHAFDELKENADMSIFVSDK